MSLNPNASELANVINNNRTKNMEALSNILDADAKLDNLEKPRQEGIAFFSKSRNKEIKKNLVEAADAVIDAEHASVAEPQDRKGNRDYYDDFRITAPNFLASISHIDDVGK